MCTLPLPHGVHALTAACNWAGVRQQRWVQGCVQGCVHGYEGRDRCTCGDGHLYTAVNCRYTPFTAVIHCYHRLHPLYTVRHQSLSPCGISLLSPCGISLLSPCGNVLPHRAVTSFLTRAVTSFLTRAVLLLLFYPCGVITSLLPVRCLISSLPCGV